jgi:hypothetical protein
MISRLWSTKEMGAISWSRTNGPKLTIPAEAMVSDLTEVLTQEESLILDSRKGADVGMSVFGNGNEYNTVIPNDEDIMDSQSIFSKDSDLEGETAGWQLSKSKKRRKTNKK